MSILNVSAVESKFINYNKLLFNNLKIATTLKSKNVTSQEFLTVFISASRDPSSRLGGIRDDTAMVVVLGRSGDSQKDILSMQSIPVRIAASSPHSSRQTVIPNEPEGVLVRREKANEGSLLHLLQASYAKPLHPDF